MNIARGVAGALRAFAHETFEATQRLRLFDANLAGASAQLMMGDFRRSLQLAGHTSVTGVELIKAINDMRDAFLPWQGAWMNFNNVAVGVGVGAAANAARGARVVPEGGEAILQFFIDPNSGWNKFMKWLDKLIDPDDLFKDQERLSLFEKMTRWLEDKGIIAKFEADPNAKKGAWDNFVRDVARGDGPHPATPFHGGFIIQGWNRFPGRMVFRNAPHNWIVP